MDKGEKGNFGKQESDNYSKLEELGISKEANIVYNFPSW